MDYLWAAIPLVIVAFLLKVWISIPRGRKSGFPKTSGLYANNPYKPADITGTSDDAFQAHLPMGMTQYYLTGPVNGPKVVLIHGITPPSIVFKELIASFTSKGFRVLAYDLYGRGYSEAPDCPYGKDLYLTQLQNLVEHLKWDQFNLLGFSMGGGVAVAFTALHPEKVIRLGLVAPAGLLEGLPFIANFVIAPVLGDLIGHSIGPRLLAAASTGSFNDCSTGFPKKIIDVCRYQIKHCPGFMRAYISTLRHFPLTGLHKDYTKVGTMTHLPVNVLWGNKDHVVHFDESRTLVKLIPHAKLVVVDGGSHNTFAELPDKMLPILASFFL